MEACSEVGRCIVSGYVGKCINVVDTSNRNVG